MITAGEHLHFNVLGPARTPDGLSAVKMSFIEKTLGGDLKKHDRVKK